MSDKLAVASCVVSIAMAGLAGWALHDMKQLEKKVAALEHAPEPGALPDAAKPDVNDPRAALASRLEMLERRLAQSDVDYEFSVKAFQDEAGRASEEIDAQAMEIMAKLAEIKANPPKELTDAILEEQVRAGLLEKRKKDTKSTLKKQGAKQLKSAKEKMNLTEEQMAVLKEYFEGLYTEWSDTLALIFTGEEVDQKVIEAKVEDTKVRTDAKMKEVLKPEQYETWKKEVEPSFYQDPFRPGGGGGGR
ncbi:MAG: hypothetical protein FD180_2747 [Planctomycetota bacterium]|nr:MAG: hypothetical protein FD180_2747 [Planctomycetota bacterium]